MKFLHCTEGVLRMKITFIGACHEVTGSAHYLSVGDKKIIIDYGMEQGVNLYENQTPPWSAAETDYVLITHAHIDHTGLLPLLYKQGFRGKVYTTNATRELCSIMLRDCAHIQQFESEWKSRKNKRKGQPPVIPLFDFEDVAGVMDLFVGCHYEEVVHICDELTVRFIDAGHLLGSASIECYLTEGDVKKKVVFSGDIGNVDQPIIKDPQYIDDADVVIMESTYGNRLHADENPNYEGDLSKIIAETIQKGGNVVIPCFAVGRTQEVLYHIRQLKQDNVIPGFEDIAVYVDSPLAVAATSIFNKVDHECLDEETLDLLSKNINPIEFKGLRLSETTDDSKAINFDKNPKVILAASGMCDAGRIRHHLKYNLWREDSAIVFAGYQSLGTPGRAILDGATSIKIFGEEIAIKARICKITGISGHADKEGLLKWASAYKKKPDEFIVVHGNDEVTDEWAQTLRDSLGVKATAPYSGAVYNIITGAWESTGVATKLRTKKQAGHTSSVYQRLLACGERLLAVIRKNEGCANKDLAKMADQIDNLCDKWDR